MVRSRAILLLLALGAAAVLWRLQVEHAPASPAPLPAPPVPLPAPPEPAPVAAPPRVEYYQISDG